jgi:kynurenine formamidase
LIAVKKSEPTDQRGAMNYVTQAVTLEALKMVGEGRIVDLSHEVRAGNPILEPFIPPFYMGMAAVPDTTRKMLKEHLNAHNDVGVFTERVEMCLHTSTHVDALGHFTIGDEMFGGHRYQDSSTNWGLTRLGIEQMPPLVTRGVVLDVAKARGVEHLDGGEVVDVDLLKRALELSGTELRLGDAVLIRTGWGRYFMTDNTKYTVSEPGIDVEAARFLTAQKICAIGADSMAVEVLPNTVEGQIFPVHQHTLVEAGVHLIENLQFDSIISTDRSEFCFVMLPVKFVGATASPVRPVALI